MYDSIAALIAPDNRTFVVDANGPRVDRTRDSDRRKLAVP